MALQDNNLMLLDLSDGFPRTLDTANDSLAIGVDTAFGADLSVGGNLTVNGDIISSGTMDVVVADNFIDLSNGQVNGSNKAGGLTVNVQSHDPRQAMSIAAGAPNDVVFSGTDTIDFGAGGYDPQAAGLAAGDVIEIAGCADHAGNNGLFIVASVTAQTITIMNGAAIAADPNGVQAPWAQTAFENGTETAAGASMAPSIDLGVFCVADGALLDAGGNPISLGLFVTAYQAAAKLSNITYESAQNVSLQEAYNVGQDILMANAKGDLKITTDDTPGSRADFRLANQANSHTYLLTGDGAVKVGDGSTIKTAMSGQVFTDITFDGSGARSIQQAGQNLTLQTTGAGANIAVGSQGGTATVAAADDLTITMAANDAATKTVLISAVNGGGSAEISLSATDKISSQTAGFDVTAGTKIDLNSQGAAADAFVMQAPNGGMDLTSSADMDLVSVNGAVNVRAQAGAVTVESNNATLLIDAKGTGAVDIDGANGVTIDAPAGGFQISGAGAASSIEAGNVNLTVQTVGGGNLLLDSADSMSSTAQNSFSITATSGSGALLANTTLGLTAGGNASLTSNTADVALSAALAGSFQAGSTLALQAASKASLLSTGADVDIDAVTNVTIDAVNNIVGTAGAGMVLTAQGGNAQLRAQGAGHDVLIDSQQASIDATAALSARLAGAQSASLESLGGVGSQVSVLSSGNAGDAIHLDASSGGVLIDGGVVQVGASTGNISIDASAAGGIGMTALNSSLFQVQGANQALTFESQQGAVSLLTGAGPASQGAVFVDGFMAFSQQTALGRGAGYVGTAKVNITAGQVVMAEPAGNNLEVGIADRTSDAVPVGIALENAPAADPCFMHTAHGVPVQTGTGVAAGDVGAFLYLDATGAMVKQAPVASGDYVWRLGTIVARDGGGNAVLLWAPQFIAKRP